MFVEAEQSSASFAEQEALHTWCLYKSIRHRACCVWIRSRGWLSCDAAHWIHTWCTNSVNQSDRDHVVWGEGAEVAFVMGTGDTAHWMHTKFSQPIWWESTSYRPRWRCIPNAHNINQQSDWEFTICGGRNHLKKDERKYYTYPKNLRNPLNYVGTGSFKKM